MKWLQQLFVLLRFRVDILLLLLSILLLCLVVVGCASEQYRGPLLVQCADASGILYQGEADELLHLVPEGYWEFYDFRAHALVRVHGDCRFTKQET